jgi:hypothetical protein
MQLFKILILLESIGIFPLTLSMNNLDVLTTEQRHIVLRVNNIVHRHLLPRKSLRVSLPPVDYNVKFHISKQTHLQEYDFNMVDTFLRVVSAMF